MQLEIDYNSLNSIFGIPLPDINASTPDQLFISYFTFLFYIIIVIGAAFLTIRVIYGGILFLTSFNNPGQRKEARDTLTAMFFGGLILLCSFLILKTINPMLVILNLPQMDPAQQTDTAPIEEYNAPELKSIISAELPFGATIQKMLDEKNGIKVDSETAVLALRKDCQETLSLMGDIKNTAEEMNAKKDNCKCENAGGRCPGCEPQKNSQIPAEGLNEEEAEIIEEYNKGASCIGEPCPEREAINNLAASNMASAKKLMEKIVFQKRIEMAFKEELSKLKTEKLFMEQCPLSQLDSQINFSVVILDYYRKEMGWSVLFFPIWPGLENDNASFFCPVSGNSRKYVQFLPDELTKELENSSQDIAGSEIGCEQIKVGEAIDRAIRISENIISKIQKMIELERAIIGGLDRFQSLISRCSAQACQSVCIAAAGSCEVHCHGTPCPIEEINTTLNEIKETMNQPDKETARTEPGISNLIDSPFDPLDLENYDNPKEIGLMQIMDNIIPSLLKDGLSKVRTQMTECIASESLMTMSDFEDFQAQEDMTVLVPCQTALWQKEEGVQIQACCQKEPLYQKCLNACYLKQDYANCLSACLKKQAAVSKCKHQINFYCCR